MRVGDVVAQRFELVEVAGSGGMGTVYKARDRADGRTVALKALSDLRPETQARFEREARVLSELSHPGIVRYLAHGEVAGEPYLAMEWLEGESLAARLLRGPLRLGEAVDLGRRVAEALAAAHARGVVHRDVKPANLFLPGGAIERVKVLDFGIARVPDPTCALTRTGEVMGTVAYMAPEQARGERDTDARVDVFALGCVLFECLAGERPFDGTHVMALLAKILFEKTPRLRDHRRDVPEALEDLVARMLSKDAAARPADGAAAARELVTLGPLDRPGGALPPSEPAVLTAEERRLVSVIVIAPAPSSGALRARAAIAAFTPRIERLADGSMVAVFTGSGDALAQAIRAAQCALTMKMELPDAAMALVMGRDVLGATLPVGEVIERAVGLLYGGPPGLIRIDPVAAGLLGARFEIAAGPGGHELRGPRAPLLGPIRTLLGRPTPCVGRDRELAALEATFAECASEPAARAVLVTGPPGAGKSRVAYELLGRLRGEAASVWIARGEPMAAGSSLAMVRQLLGQAVGLFDGEPPGDRRRKLCVRVDERFAPAEARRVAAFLGEILGCGFPDDDLPELRAARQESALMTAQTRRAWEDFVAVEGAGGPLLILLEDLHWADRASIQLVDAALRVLCDRPLLVLATARPEVRDLWPRLWADRALQEIPLGSMSQRASERLAREVLGDAIPQRVIDRVVERAAGNAFCLEELIRSVAEGRGEALPETVLLLVQARLEGLDEDSRRLLRAASVFGEVFWQGGVSELLGGRWRTVQTEEWLNLLVAQEVLVGHPDSRFPGERELAFRHALLREGAYAMLTDDDRRLGHRLAAAWLEGAGEGDPLILAEHFDRGHEPGRAAAHYLRASERALRGSDANVAVTLALKALDCGPEGDLRVLLLGTLCEAYAWLSQADLADVTANEVLEVAAPGSAPWARAVVTRLLVSLTPGAPHAFVTTLRVALTASPSADAVSTMALALAAGSFLAQWEGFRDLAEATRARLRAIVAPVAGRDPIARAWLDTALAFSEPLVNEAPWGGLVYAEAAQASFQEARHSQGAVIARIQAGLNLWLLGAHQRAMHALEGPMAEGNVVMSAMKLYFTGALADAGSLDEALAMTTPMIACWSALRYRSHEGVWRWMAADVLRRLGRLGEAEREALAALDILPRPKPERAALRATLAAIQLGQGRPAEALTSAEAAMAELGALGGFAFKGSFVHLVRAEALRAAGDRAAAAEAIAAARERLLGQASTIVDPALARSFLEGVPENARTLGLAKEWEGTG